MDGPLIAGVGGVVALAVTPVAARVALRYGVLDHPGSLKVQQRPVPYLGGVAVFVAAGVAAVAGGIEALWLVPLALALILGVIDDVKGLGARSRLGGEALIGLLAGFIVPAPGPAGFVITALGVVGLINAVNLLDGLDGLASGVVCASAIGFAALGFDGRPLALGLAGGLAGFLVFNRPPARIYLGDGGSYLLGAALAMLAAGALHHESEPVYWIIVPLLVAVPLGDTAIAIIRRARAHRPIFSGDRSHVYDQLVDRGQTRGQATLTCIALQTGLVVAGVVAWHLSDGVAAIVAVTTLAVFSVSAIALGFATPGENL
jgi:UDP-GlcNAc:undecaprenyl-phosphate/decaprenyl-phosphate GlcNAc-1-phosphate transferase